MTGALTPQLIKWTKGTYSGATELKTMGHEKASDTCRENNITIITMPTICKNPVNRTMDELSISMLAL